MTFLKVFLKLFVIILTIALVGLFLGGIFDYLTWGQVFEYLFKGFWLLLGAVIIWVITVMMNITGRDKDI